MACHACCPRRPLAGEHAEDHLASSRLLVAARKEIDELRAAHQQLLQETLGAACRLLPASALRPTPHHWLVSVDARKGLVPVSEVKVALGEARTLSRNKMEQVGQIQYL
jgi:hypothetical protein